MRNPIGNSAARHGAKFRMSSGSGLRRTNLLFKALMLFDQGALLLAERGMTVEALVIFQSRLQQRATVPFSEPPIWWISAMAADFSPHVCNALQSTLAN